MNPDHNLLDPYFQEYQDRGIIKWAGFYLSEHTAALEKEKQQQTVIPRLKQQSSAQIDFYLSQSIKHNKVLEIQLNTLDHSGRVKPHLFGVFIGIAKEETLAITDPIAGFRYLEYADIRHIRLHDFKKWSAIEHKGTTTVANEKHQAEPPAFPEEFDAFFHDENWHDFMD